MIASRFFQRHRFASGVGSALLVVSLLFAAGAAAVSFPRTAGHCPEMSCVGKRQAASGVTYRGTWKPGTRYHKNDIVYSGGSSYVAKKPSSHLAPATHHAAWGLLARGGTSANVVSGHAEDQNSFVYVDSTTTPIVAVQLSGVGGQPLSVGFKARLQVSGVVRLRNNTGTGNLDQSICWPQVAVQGGSWQDIGPQMIGLTHGDNSFNDEVSIPVMGGTDVSPGVYDARIVCQRVYVTGGASQNKFNGDALVVTAVPR